jgi:hypothetical protein
MFETLGFAGNVELAGHMLEQGRWLLRSSETGPLKVENPP